MRVADLVEETLEDDGVLVRQHAQRREGYGEIFRQLLGGGRIEQQVLAQPALAGFLAFRKMPFRIAVEA